jgi:hypothetical protein
MSNLAGSKAGFIRRSAAAQQLQAGKTSFVSSGVVANQNGQPGFRKALLVRDPDGHAILITENEGAS